MPAAAQAAEYLAPGVYVEETQLRSKTIQAVGTSTAAFIGETEKNVDPAPRLVTSYADFQRFYGGPVPGSHLAHSVRLFFANGGTRLYIASVDAPAGAGFDERAYRRAFALLDKLEDIRLVAVPGVGSGSMIEFATQYCRKRGDCFFIADLRPSVNDAAQARQALKARGYRSSYAAQYFPWLRINDPATQSPVTVPPSGAVAGIYARVDAGRGVWKAPAGLQAGLRGVTGLTVSITNAQQRLLSPLGLNVIRAFPGRGMLVWGARTLDSADPEFRYVPVRRTAMLIEQSIREGTGWAVFEPNDARLWGQLDQSISGFMYELFRQGAFAGATPDEAFFVRCDHHTTTAADINNGVVNVVVGFAPLKPAEFVIVKIRQKAGARP